MADRIKRAGDVNGTPDWQRTEEQFPDEKMRNTAELIKWAIDNLRVSIRWLVSAASDLKGYPIEDHILSNVDDLEETLMEVKMLKRLCEGK